MVRVLSFEPAPNFPNWYVLEIERKEHPKLLVHRNWVNENGFLKPGDEVLAEGTHLTYSHQEYPCALTLARIAKPAIEA